MDSSEGNLCSPAHQCEYILSWMSRKLAWASAILHRTYKGYLFSGECSRNLASHTGIGTSWAASHIGYNSESILGMDDSPLSCLHLALAYRYYFVWRRHDNMPPCTSIRVNTNYSMRRMPVVRTPGPRLNIKTVLSTYGDFHVKDKTAVRTSYL